MARKAAVASQHLSIWTSAVVSLLLLMACGSKSEAPLGRSDHAARLQGSFKASRNHGTSSVQKIGAAAASRELAWLSDSALELEDGGRFLLKKARIWFRKGSVEFVEQVTCRGSWSLANGRLRLVQEELSSTMGESGTPSQEDLHFLVREKEGHFQLDGVNTSTHFWSQESSPLPEVGVDSLAAKYWREPFVRWRGDQSAAAGVGKGVTEFETGTLMLKADGTFVRTVTRTGVGPGGLLDNSKEILAAGRWRASGRSVMLSSADPLAAAGDEVLEVGRVAGQYCLTRNNEEVWHQQTD